MLNKEKLEEIKKVLSLKIFPSSQHRISYYDEISGAIAGARHKQFVRSDANIFADVLNEIRDNENCTYLTHANAVIKEGFYPKKLSTIIKYLDYTKTNSTESKDFIVPEIISPQILNYYGVNTCCNIATKYDKTEEYQMVSIDFVTFGSEFYTFDELNYVLGCNLDRDIYYQLPELFKQDEFKDVEREEIDKICEQYVYSYLVRRFVLRDGDFAHTNCGILKQEDGKLHLVNFDYEYAFDMLDFGEYLDDDVVKSELILAYENYPDIVMKFIEKTEELYEGLTILKDQIEYQLDEHEICVNRLMKNLQNLLKFIKTLEKEQTM